MVKKQIFIIAVEETYKYGDIIFQEGGSGDWVYVILSGSVEISKTVNGHKYIIEILKQGELFGELESIGRIKRTSTARAIDNTTLGIIDRDLVDKEYNQLSQQFRSILESLIKRKVKLLDRVSRYTEREEFRLQRVLAVSYKDREAFMDAYTTNISTGGLFIKTDNFLNPGKQFLLKLQLPEVSQPLQIECEVVWARKREKKLPNDSPGMGVKFTKISKADYSVFRTFLTAEIGEDHK